MNNTSNQETLEMLKEDGIFVRPAIKSHAKKMKSGLETYRPRNTSVKSSNQKQIISTSRHVAVHIIGSANSTKYGKYYALVIGNYDYRYLPKLTSVKHDVEAISRVLSNNFNFEVEYLLNTKRDVALRSLEAYRKKLNKNDNFLLYYAGHGVFDKASNRGYWLPIDSKDDSSVKWISNTAITDMIRAFRSKHVLIVADSCYSGTLTRGVKVKLDQSSSSLLASKRSRTVLTSGGLEPVLDGGGGTNSIFAKHLISGLDNVNQEIDMTTLFSKIRRLIILNSPQTPEYSDIRMAGHEGGDFILTRK
jgi:uncharacterized caspase-like protein